MVVNDEASSMRHYWDDRARENAVWYVDTSCDYADPNMARFWDTGAVVVREALGDAPLRPSGRRVAVEIGSGLGRVCQALVAEFDEVIGIDVAPEMVTQARHYVDDPRIRFEVGNGTDLASIADASVDLVMTFTVFQHLPTRSLIDGYVREAARVLRPGGVLAAQWNNLPHPLLWKLQGARWRFERRVGLRPDERAAPQFLGLRVPADRVRVMCERAGLVPGGTKGEGTLFAWIWAEKPASPSPAA
ncbi:MAG: class I SAM-dependent methyltransferase [Acidimicrobiales bacterium]